MGRFNLLGRQSNLLIGGQIRLNKESPSLVPKADSKPVFDLLEVTVVTFFLIS